MSDLTDLLVQMQSVAPGDELDALIAQALAAYLAEPRAATGKGLPYPAPTDPIASGATAIQALAEAVDLKIFRQVQGGSVAVNLANATSGSTAVSFAPAFSATPLILLTKSANAAGGMLPFYSGVTTAGFTVNLGTTNGATYNGSISVTWLAFLL